MFVDFCCRKTELKRSSQNLFLKRDRVHDFHYTAPDPKFDAKMAMTVHERLSFDNSILEQSFTETDCGGTYNQLQARP